MRARVIENIGLLEAMEKVHPIRVVGTICDIDSFISNIKSCSSMIYSVTDKGIKVTKNPNVEFFLGGHDFTSFEITLFENNFEIYLQSLPDLFGVLHYLLRYFDKTGIKVEYFDIINKLYNKAQGDKVKKLFADFACYQEYFIESNSCNDDYNKVDELPESVKNTKKHLFGQERYYLPRNLKDLDWLQVIEIRMGIKLADMLEFND